MPSVSKPRAIRHFGLGDEIAAADLDRIDAESRRDRVHQALAHERAFVAAGRAIGAARRLVGQADVADHAIGRHAIGAGQHGGGEIGHGRGVGAHIGALVVKELAVDGEQAAVGIDRGANAVVLLARMIGGDQMLAPVLDPFHRPAEPQRAEADQHVLGIKLAAHAEAAADVAFVEMHARRRAAEHAGQMLSRFQCGTLAAPCSSRMSRAAS